MKKEVLKKEYSNVKIINFLIYSIMAIMPFIVIPGTKQPYITGKAIYLYLIFMAILLLVIVDRMKIKVKTEEKIISIFLLSLIIATIFSIDVETAIIGKTGRYEGLLMNIIYITLFVVTIKYNEISFRIIEVISLFSVGMGVYAVLQFYNIDPIAKLLNLEEFSRNSFGTIGNRNYMATYFLMFLIINLAIYIIYNKKKYFFYSSILFAGLLSTLTRSCWLAFVAIGIIGIIQIRKRKSCVLRCISILIIFCSIFVVMNSTSENTLVGRTNELVLDIKQFDDDSGSGRIMIWKMVLDSIKEHPLLGSGLDTLDGRLLIDQFEESMELAMKGLIVDKSHNEFLEYWVCGGILTLISYISLVVVILFKLYSKKSDDISKIFMLTIIGYVIQSFFNISVIAVAPLYWILLGAAVKHYRDLDKAKEVQAIKE